jgi:hypothetical protein
MKYTTVYVKSNVQATISSEQKSENIKTMVENNIAYNTDRNAVVSTEVHI